MALKGLKGNATNQAPATVTHELKREKKLKITRLRYRFFNWIMSSKYNENTEIWATSRTCAVLVGSYYYFDLYVEGKRYILERLSLTLRGLTSNG